MSIREDPAAQGARFGRLLLLTVAFIVYGSTYPWDFADIGPVGNRLLLLLETWPIPVNRYLISDVSLNLLLYVPVGVFAYLKFTQALGPAAAAALTIAGGTILSTSVEIVQQFEISRSSSAIDLTCNILGTATGVAVGHFARSTLVGWSRKHLTKDRSEGRSALVLLLLWAAYQVVPLFPAMSITRLHSQIQGLLQPGSFGRSEFLTSVAEWLAAARLAEAFLPDLAGPLLTILVLLVPARLVIAGRTATSAEILGAAAAGILWAVWLAKSPKRTQWAAGCAIAAIILRGLAPFKFAGHPQAFTWIPFGGALSYEYAAAQVPMLRKAFEYGAALWLVTTSGAGRLRALVAIGILVSAIEAIQVYMPAHTPEITDPVLVVLLAAVLRLLDPPRL